MSKLIKKALSPYIIGPLAGATIGAGAGLVFGPKNKEFATKENVRRLLRNIILGSGVGLGLVTAGDGISRIASEFKSASLKKKSSKSRLLTKLIKKADSKGLWSNPTANYALAGGGGLLSSLLAYHFLNDEKKRNLGGYLNAGLLGLGGGLAGAGLYNIGTHGGLFGPPEKSKSVNTNTNTNTKPNNSEKPINPVVATEEPTASDIATRTLKDQGYQNIQSSTAINGTAVKDLDYTKGQVLQAKDNQGTLHYFVLDDDGTFRPIDTGNSENNLLQRYGVPLAVANGIGGSIIGGTAAIAGLRHNPPEWYARLRIENNGTPVVFGSPEYMRFATGSPGNPKGGLVGRMISNALGYPSPEVIDQLSSQSVRPVRFNKKGDEQLSLREAAEMSARHRTAQQWRALANNNPQNELFQRWANLTEQRYLDALSKGFTLGEIPDLASMSRLTGTEGFFNPGAAPGTSTLDPIANQIRFSNDPALMQQAAAAVRKVQAEPAWQAKPGILNELDAVRDLLPESMVQDLNFGQFATSELPPEFTAGLSDAARQYVEAARQNYLNHPSSENARAFKEAVFSTAPEVRSGIMENNLDLIEPGRRQAAADTLNAVKNLQRQVELAKKSNIPFIRGMLPELQKGYNDARSALFRDFPVLKPTLVDVLTASVKDFLPGGNNPTSPNRGNGPQNPQGNSNSPQAGLSGTDKAVLQDTINNTVGRSMAAIRDSMNAGVLPSDSEILTTVRDDISDVFHRLNNPELEQYVRQMPPEELMSYLNQHPDYVQFPNELETARRESARTGRVRNPSIPKDFIKAVYDSGNILAIESYQNMRQAYTTLINYQNMPDAKESTIAQLHARYRLAEAEFEARTKQYRGTPTILDILQGRTIVPKKSRPGSSGSEKLDAAIDNLGNNLYPKTQRERVKGLLQDSFNTLNEQFNNAGNNTELKSRITAARNRLTELQQNGYNMTEAEINAEIDRIMRKFEEEAARTKPPKKSPQQRLDDARQRNGEQFQQREQQRRAEHEAKVLAQQKANAISKAMDSLSVLYSDEYFPKEKWNEISKALAKLSQLDRYGKDMPLEQLTAEANAIADEVRKLRTSSEPVTLPKPVVVEPRDEVNGGANSQAEQQIKPEPETLDDWLARKEREGARKQLQEYIKDEPWFTVADDAEGNPHIKVIDNAAYQKALQEENKQLVSDISKLPKGSPEKARLEAKVRENRSYIDVLSEAGRRAVEFVIENGKRALRIAAEKGKKRG